MVCEKCKAVVDDAARFCPKCGESLSGNTETAVIGSSGENGNTETAIISHAGESGNTETAIISSAGESGNTETALMTRPDEGARASADGVVGSMPSTDTLNGNSRTIVISRKNRTKKKSRVPLIIIAVVAVIAVAAAGYFVLTRETAEEAIADALECVSQGNNDGAVAAYGKAATLDPTNAATYIGIANIYLGEGRLEEAAEVLSEGFTNTNSEEIWDMLQDTLFRIRKEGR